MQLAIITEGEFAVVSPYVLAGALREWLYVA